MARPHAGIWWKTAPASNASHAIAQPTPASSGYPVFRPVGGAQPWRICSRWPPRPPPSPAIPTPPASPSPCKPARCGKPPDSTGSPGTWTSPPCKAFPVEASQDVEIEKVGDTLVLRPVVKRKLTGLAEAFAMFTPDFMAEGREFHEQKERDWSGFGEAAQLHQTSADYKSGK